MLQGEHSAIILTCIKLPLVIKVFVVFFLSDHFRQVLLYRLNSAFYRPAKIMTVTSVVDPEEVCPL